MLSFEPQSTNFASLEKSVGTSRWDWQIERVALSSNSGTAVLNVGASSCIHSLKPIPPDFVQIGTELVQTRTLAEVLEEVPDSQRLVLKIDAEGAEYELLETTPIELLREVDTAYIEFHPRSEFERFRDLFARAGLTITSTDPVCVLNRKA